VKNNSLITTYSSNRNLSPDLIKRYRILNSDIDINLETRCVALFFYDERLHYKTYSRIYEVR